MTALKFDLDIDVEIQKLWLPSAKVSKPANLSDKSSRYSFTFKNRRKRREYVLATNVNQDEWEAIIELAAKRRRTISDLIRFLLVEETRRTAQ